MSEPTPGASDDEAYVFPTSDGPVAVPEDLARELSRPFRAWELRRDRWAWADIANELGYPSAKAASTDVLLWAQRAGALVADQDRQVMLSVEVATIDQVVRSMMKKVTEDANVNAAMVVLRAVKVKSDLLHLDTAAPQTNPDEDGQAVPSVVRAEPEHYSQDLQKVIDGD